MDTVFLKKKIHTECNQNVKELELSYFAEENLKLNKNRFFPDLTYYMTQKVHF
jgi:hypothetical protein